MQVNKLSMFQTLLTFKMSLAGSSSSGLDAQCNGEGLESLHCWNELFYPQQLAD